MGVIRHEIGHVTEYVERMYVLKMARFAFREMSLADHLVYAISRTEVLPGSSSL